MTWTLRQSLASVSGPIADGTALTISNSNIKAPTVGASSTNAHVFRTAARMGAADGFSIEQQASAPPSSFWYMDLAAPITGILGLRFPIQYGATPTTSFPFLRFFSDTAHADNLGSLSLTTANRIQMLEDNSGGGTPYNQTTTSGGAINPTAANPFVGLVKIDLAANTFDFRMYARGSATLLTSLTGTLAADLAAATQIQSIRWGAAAVNALPGSYLYTSSDFAIGDGDWPDRVDVTNTTPTANAGPDQVNVEPRTPVTLNGTGSSDADAGDSITYAWTQTAGTTVTLSSSTAASPTFTSPLTLAGDTLTFSLVVTDSHGAASSPDTVNITVLPADAVVWTGSAWSPRQIMTWDGSAWV